MLRHRRRPAPFLALIALTCAAPMMPGESDATRAIRTDRLDYTMRRTDGGLEVAIPFTYRNATGRTVYVVNCRRIAPPALQKQVDGEWVYAWSAPVPLCLSPPIVIEAGQTYSDTLRVFAGPPSGDGEPKLHVNEIEGTYRLAWHGVVHDYDSERQGFGEPLDLDERVSNPFLLRVE